MDMAVILSRLNAGDLGGRHNSKFQVRVKKYAVISGERLGFSERFPSETLQGHSQPIRPDGLEKLIHGVHFKCFHREGIIGCNEDDFRDWL